jgi:hypothetical protein
VKQTPEPRRKAKPRNRLWAVLLLSLLVFALIEGLDLFSLRRPAEDWSGLQQLDHLQLGLSILFWPLLPLGLYLIYFGIRTLSAGQFPPPGSRLIRRVEVERGHPARFRGWAAILAGMGLCVLAVYGAVIVPAELAALVPG